MSTPLQLLRKRYPEPAWLVLEQVRNGTGWARTPRTADMLAIGTWPSRGMEIIGFEEKASRADWLRELQNPAKADAIGEYCDRWYLLVTDEKIVELGEVPATWGLIAVRGKRLVDVKPAPERPTPKPLDRLLLAAMLRAARSGMTPASEVERLIEERTKRYSDTETSVRERLERALEDKTRKLVAFERESGVSIERWSHDGDVKRAEEVGRALRFILGGGLPGAIEKAGSVSTELRRVANDLDKIAGMDLGAVAPLAEAL